MSFRNISAWSIRNPIPAIVLFFMLTVAGLVSFSRMQVNQQPDIDIPVIVVTVSQPGAAPSELENQVTQKIEGAVRSLQGIDEIDSTVTEGVSTTVVKLTLGTPIDRAVEDVRGAIQQVRSDLPDGILEPQVSRVDTTDNDLASYAAVGTDLTVEQLSWYIDNDVTKELLTVPGLAKVDRNGGVSREIRIILDPAKLQAYGLTAAGVNLQLRQVNLNAAGGRAEIAGSEQSVRVLGNAKGAYELGQTLIAVGGGRTVRLNDVAQVQDLYAEQRSSSSLNGRQVISFDFQRSKGGSDVAVFAAAKEKLAELEKRNPKVHFQLIRDSVRDTLIEYHSAMEAMYEGAALAVLIVFLFLRDWRSTVISAIAIPLSAIPTFYFLSLLGFSLNFMVLMALSLVAGVLVDDAIVEIENIVRHMRMGKSAYQASIDAADEIGLAVLATTMAIVAVFLPVALMPGVPGQYFKNFGLTVVVSVLLSLGVARLITPMIAAYFLKAHGVQEHGGSRVLTLYARLLAWTLDDRHAKRVAARGGVLRRLGAWFLDHRVWVIGIGALSFVLTCLCFSAMPMEFQPEGNEDSSTAVIEMVPGTTRAETQVVVNRVAAILAKQPQVVSVYARTGVGTGRVTAIYKPQRDRSMTSAEFEHLHDAELTAIPDARVSFRSQQGWGGSGLPVTVVLGGDDPKLLAQTANAIVDQMRGLRTVNAPRVVGDLRRPEIVIKPRFDLAASLGVTTQALSSAVRIATLGDIDQNSAKFSLSDRQVPIRVALAQSSRQRLSTIQNLPVATQAGGSVPLSVVAEIGFGAGPTKIERVAQKRQLTIGATLPPNVLATQALADVHKLPAMKNLPTGVAELTLGQQKLQAEMISNFFVAVVSGVFLVFAVLVLLYRRILPPFVNMGSLLLAPLGALVALMIAGQPLSLPVFIGLLMLLGIVAKNSILLIDFALEEMHHGVDLTTAIIDAGHKRAQPIVMTTVAMVAGMIPTALALTGDTSFRQPMGITVIGGLILSTVLTLLIVPAAFSLAVGVEQWVGPRLGRRLLSYRPGDDGSTVIGPIDRPGAIGYGDSPAAAE